MKLHGSIVLPGTPEQVWSLLTDSARMAKLLPGCERLEPDGPDRYKAAVKFAIAAISGKYAGTLEYAEKKPPKSLRIRINGKGVPGFMNGEGQLELAVKNGQTEVRYSGEAHVGGLVASVGQRMIEMAARRIVRQFFEGAAKELTSSVSAEIAPFESHPHQKEAPMATKISYVIKFVSDMNRAVKFYRDTLGLPLKFESPGWSEFVTGDVTLALHPASEKNPAGGVELGFTTGDLRKTYEDLKAKGVQFPMAPTKQDFGGLLAQFVDSEGGHCSLGEVQAAAG